MTMIRLFQYQALCVLSLLMLVSASAEAKDARNVTLESGFSPQSFSLDAEGVYNMEDSATLRERGCVGFVAQNPSLIIKYKTASKINGLELSASSTSDIVLLVGTSSGDWLCSKPTETTTIRLQLPPGSNAYSIWVGTYRKGTSSASLTTQEYEKVPDTGPCASPYAHHPDSISSQTWAQYACMDEAQTAQWDQCLPRTAYSTNAKDGCPGAQRCCPGAESSNADTRTTNTTNVTTTSTHQDAIDEDPDTQEDEDLVTDGIPDPDDQNPEYEPYTVAPIGAIAEGAPHQNTIHATPFGGSRSKVHIAWVGFDDARLPAYPTAVERGEPLFYIQGPDLQKAISDSMMVIETPRSLRATKAVQLRTEKAILNIAVNQEVLLLGRHKSECILVVDKQEQRATCPQPGDFVGTKEDFWGWSPVAYQWWVAVEDANQQRGWLHIDLRQPEFRITVDP